MKGILRNQCDTSISNNVGIQLLHIKEFGKFSFLYTTPNVSIVFAEFPFRHYTLYLKSGQGSIWPSPCAFFSQTMVTTSSLVLREI